MGVAVTDAELAHVNLRQMGVAVTDAELAHVNLRPARTRGGWNYRIDPNDPRSTDK
jgi:hypothetical protein